MAVRKLTLNERTQLVDALITNGCGCWKEEDRDLLQARTDNRLVELVEGAIEHEQKEAVVNALVTKFPNTAVTELPTLVTNSLVVNRPPTPEETAEAAKKTPAKPAAPAAPAAEGGEEETTEKVEVEEEETEEPVEEEEEIVENANDKTKKKTTTGFNPQPLVSAPLGDGRHAMSHTRNNTNTKGQCTMNAAEWLAANNAPPEITEIVNNSLAQVEAQRQSMVAKIVANRPGTAEQKQQLTTNLLNKTTEDLQFMVSLLPQQAPTLTRPTNNYLGNGGPAVNRPTVNEDDQDVLEIPTLNYAEKVGA